MSENCREEQEILEICEQLKAKGFIGHFQLTDKYVDIFFDPNKTPDTHKERIVSNFNIMLGYTSFNIGANHIQIWYKDSTDDIDSCFM